MNLLEVYPWPVVLLDYIMAIIMWTLLGRGVLDLFISPDRDFVMAKVFRQITDPVIKFFDRITPSFLLSNLIPFYVAWWFYIVRYYAIPYIFFGVMGTLSIPLDIFQSK